MFYCEMNEARSDGRRRIKLVLHEIHPDREHYNYNGISYNEEYVRNNADSVIGMPICASFLDDDKDIPYDHGMTGQEGNMPVYEDSVQVGVADGWEITDIAIDGEIHRVLVAYGYINEQRYPRFVEWLKNKLNNQETVYGSVEFVGKGDNKIVYDGEPVAKGRVPMVYSYSGYCILTVAPADSSAVVIELNQKIKTKEEDLMDEKIVSQITGAVTDTIKEINSKNAEYEKTISELNEVIAGKDKEIEELNACKKQMEDNACKKNKEYEELNAACKKMKEELNACKKANCINELNEKLSGYTEDEIAVANEKIEQYKADPIECGIEINEIVTEINAAIGVKAKAKEQAEITAEINSKNSVSDIFGNVELENNSSEELDIDGIF